MEAMNVILKIKVETVSQDLSQNTKMNERTHKI